ncbi:MAG: metallophosphoesterase [Verrucomicrobiales bacterium]|nr:metallophosphoesterase [Verrucomicrobiales bacterium]
MSYSLGNWRVLKQSVNLTRIAFIGGFGTWLLLASARAQINVGTHGAGPITFDLLPPVEEWATRQNIGGSSADIVNAASLDLRVQTNTAAMFNLPLVSSSGNPPNGTAAGLWSSAGHYIQTRPAEPGYSAILATFRNSSGQDLSILTLAYDLNVPFTVPGEEVRGHRVYYSLTGQQNSWINIPDFNNDRTSGHKQALLDFTASRWSPGSLMFILWADEDGSSSPDDPLEIDNVEIAVEPALVRVVSPTNGQTFVAGAPIPFRAIGVPIGTHFLDFNANGFVVATADSPPFIRTNRLAAGSYTITATAHTDAENVSSTNLVVVTVLPNAPPIIATVTNHLAATQFLVGSNLIYTAVVTDDSAVSNVSFYVDGVNRWNDASSPYTFGWGDMVAGVHTLQVVATDDSGASSTNLSIITVTNPPNTQVIVANGQPWNYWDNGIDPGPGWKARIFDDSGWSNGIAEIGYGDAAVSRPEVTISRRIIGAIGDPNAITNATQLFRRAFALSTSDITSCTGMVVRLLADDGGIVYLNGIEIYRSTNMPINTTYATLATSPMADDGKTFMEASFDKNLFVAGLNTVAVEVHQAGPNASSMSFDLMLWGQKKQGPRLSIFKTSPHSNEGHILWTGSGAVLQSSSDPSDPNGWSDIDPGSYSHPDNDPEQNDLTVDLSSPGSGRMLFRTRQ